MSFSTRPFSLLASLAVVVGTVLVAACDNTEYVVVEKPEELRPIGESCVLDDECNGGRCVGGVCDDGLCSDNTECRETELCVFGECVPADQFACTGDQAPLAGISPLDVQFGEVALGNTGEAVITIENKGDCLLTVQEIFLSSTGSPGFSCDECDPTTFPQRLPPQRTLDVTVRFTPPAPGSAATQLFIRTDDATAGLEGLVTANLAASYSGVPVILIDPVQLNFGNVSVGTDRTHDVTVRNIGSGNAALTIEGIYVWGAPDFTIPPELDGIRPTSPLLLPPYDPNDPTTEVVIAVTLTPTQLANYEANLYIEAHYGDATAGQSFAVALTGSSLGPPQINVSPLSLTFQEDDGTAYAVGMVAFRQVTISNSGQSQLDVNLALSDPSGDFSLSPSFLPPIAPGGSILVSVFYNPSEPSDPANPHDPTTPVSAFLNITSNDDDPASDVLKVVNLTGWARGGTFDDVLKVEMEYENADNSWAGNDFRNVDLELLSPLGFSCTKPIPQYQPDGNGGYIVTSTEDPCEDWSGTTLEGTANWLAVGQYEEPERILLYGLGQDLSNGQTFTARIHYIEDCANIPTGILADVLGIGGSILLGLLGGAIGIPIAVPPDQISDLISENCWDRESSQTTVHVFINGQPVGDFSHRLENKGDYYDIVKIKREDGQFVLLP
jgi:hypothetical protein